MMSKRRFRILAIVAALVILFAAQYAARDANLLGRLVDNEAALREFGDRRPALMMWAAFFAYVVGTGLSLPIASALSLALGWYFGFWKALLVVSFGSTLGATLAFLASRYLFRDVVQSRFESQLARVNDAFQREGGWYLFSMRLIPAIPFFLINLLMGLTAMKAPTFWWISQLGMLPGTIAYVFAGSSLPTLQAIRDQRGSGIVSPKLLVAFAVVGALPLVLRLLIRRGLEREA